MTPPRWDSPYASSVRDELVRLVESVPSGPEPRSRSTDLRLRTNRVRVGVAVVVALALVIPATLFALSQHADDDVASGGRLTVATADLGTDDPAVAHSVLSGTLQVVRTGTNACFFVDNQVSQGASEKTYLVFPRGYSASRNLDLLDSSGKVAATDGERVTVTTSASKLVLPGSATGCPAGRTEGALRIRRAEPTLSTPTPTPTATATGTTPTATATAPSTPTSSTNPNGVSSGTTSSGDSNRPVDQCADSVLKVQLSMPKGTAHHTFIRDVDFTNTGGSACVLRGAPGLSVVGDGSGTQLGAAAARDQSDAKDVVLAANGGTAYAVFGGSDLDPKTGTPGLQQCAGGASAGDGYRIYPPHSTRAFFVRDSDSLACRTGGAFLHVGIVLAEGTAG